jgi:hypothetical protein
MHGCFILFNILDHACTTCFIFANYFGKSLQSLFANSQRYMSKIARSIFKIWNFLPLFQMLFLWLKQKLPLNEILLLVFKRVLDTNFESRYTKIYQLKEIKFIWYQFEKFLKILNLVVVRSFCFGLIFSPPLALIAKNRDFVSPFNFLLHW